MFTSRRDNLPFPVFRVGISLLIARVHEIGRTAFELDALLLLALPLLLTLQKLEPLLIDDNQALLRELEIAPLFLQFGSQFIVGLTPALEKCYLTLDYIYEAHIFIRVHRQYRYDIRHLLQ